MDLAQWEVYAGLDTISGDALVKVTRAWFGNSSPPRIMFEGCRRSTQVVRRKTPWQRETDWVGWGHVLGTALQSHAEKVGSQMQSFFLAMPCGM